MAAWHPGSGPDLFSRKGVVIVPKGSLTEDDATVGARRRCQEVNDLGEAFEVVSAAGDVVAVRTALQEQGIDYESADTSFLPSMSVEVDEHTARKVFRQRRRPERLRQRRREGRDPGSKRRIAGVILALHVSRQEKPAHEQDHAPGATPSARWSRVWSTLG